MATCHHIPDKKLLEVFPELSFTESNVMTLYSLGMPAATIAQSQNKSVRTINNHIANIKLKLSTESAYDLRTLYTIRIMLKLIKTPHHENCKIFPYLSDEQENVLLMLVSGISEKAISYDRKMTINEVYKVLEDTSLILGAVDTSALKGLVCMKITEHILNTLL